MSGLGDGMIYMGENMMGKRGRHDWRRTGRESKE
jgi:hypothetical protein